MSPGLRQKAELYTRYPLSSIIIYNGSTVLHYLLGGAGIIIGYSYASWTGTLFGALYLVFSFVEMYIVMPLTVCRHCVYYKIPGSLCISGLNVISQKIAKEGDIKNFAGRAEGPFCFNNMYIAALVIPIIAIVPAFFINFSIPLLLIFITLITLLLFRFFVIFTKIACLHCRAKFKCPQAAQMGVREL